METSTASVVIATAARSPALLDTLKAVRPQAQELGAEVLMVINRDAGEVAPAIRDGWNGLVDTVLFESRPGKSHALNLAADSARGELLAFIDDDATPSPGWLRALLGPLLEERAATDGGRLAGSGGRVWPVYPAGGAPTWYRPLINPRKTSFLGPLHDLGPESRDYLPVSDEMPIGTNCCFRRKLLRGGAFRADLGPNHQTGMRGGEDTELALRLMRAGWRIRYVPQAVVYHPVTPDRLQRGFVSRAYYQQGIETERLKRILGEASPSPSRLRLKILRHTLRGLIQSARGRYGRHRYPMRIQFLRGRLNESRRKEPAA